MMINSGRKRGLQEELKYLTSGELVATILFWLIHIKLFCGSSNVVSTKTIIFSVYSLIILTIILLQGAFYWNNNLRKIQKKPYISRSKIAQIYYILKWSNWSVIVGFIPVSILTIEEVKIPVIVGFTLVYVFAVIEQINYFHVRLSYGGKTFGFDIVKPLKQVLMGTTKKSQIAKDIALRSRS